MLITTLVVLTGTTLISPPARADLLVGSGTDAASASVLRFSDSGSFLGVFVAPGDGLQSPRGLAFGPDGNLYVATNNDRILRYNGATGAFIDTFITPTGEPLHQPEQLIFRGGFLYVSTFGNDGINGNSVVRYNATTGAYVSTFVPPGTGGLNLADDMVFGRDGRLYVSSAGTNQVLRFDGTTGAFVDPFASGFDFSGPRGLTFDAVGNLYASDLDQNNPGVSDSVRKYAPDGTRLADFVPAGSGGLNFPRGITFGPDGNLYVASENTNQVLRYDGTTGAFLNAFASGNGLTAPVFFTFHTFATVPEPSPMVSLASIVSLTLLGGAWRRWTQMRTAPVRRVQQPTSGSIA
jgi:glucose/arabinose dehydrogenase